MIRFSLFGFPVQIQPLFWLICFLLGGGLDAGSSFDFSKLINWSLILFLSILIHELGHAFAGRRFGAEPSIVFHGLGGLTFFPEGRFTRSQRIGVIAAGPAASFALGGIFWIGKLLAGPLPPYEIWRFLDDGFRVNCFWVFINLLPIQPLDGGQICREILGPQNFAITRWIGMLTGLGLMLWALSNRQIVLAVFAGYLAWANYKGRVVMPGKIA